MTPLDWFKKEKPLLGLLGTGGGNAIGGVSSDPVTVKYILVGGGGGGGGGQGGGGGGAGAVRYATLELAGGEDHPYQVGDGGVGVASPNFPTVTGRGGQGTTSWFSDPTITAGGGGGGGWQQAGPPGAADVGADGSPFGGGGAGGGQTGPWEASSTGGNGGTAHPEVNMPLGSTYGGARGYGGPGGGSGNRGGGGAGTAQHGTDAEHGGPSAGGPTQNPGSGQKGGNGGLGMQVPTGHIPTSAAADLIPASTANGASALYVYNPTTSYDMPAPENFFGVKAPTTPYTYRLYFGSGGGGGAETERGGYGAGSPGWLTTGNYGGGGPAAGNSTNDPSLGANGAPGLNGRGGGGGGGGPGGNIAPGVNPASPTGSWPNQGHPGGAGILIVQYPKDRTLTRSQPTYTSIISGPTPEGFDYFVALGPAGPSKGYAWPHPGQGTLNWA